MKYNKILKYAGVLAALLLSSATAFAQVALNPCNTSAVRTTKAIAITTATTTELVSLVAGQTVYACEVSLTISQVVTTANIIKFVYGTGSACATGAVDLTGGFGTGGITVGPPISVNAGGFKTIASNALCATTTIGGSAAFSGVLSYIQQ